MKKTLSLILTAVLILVSLALTSCKDDPPGMMIVKVSEIGKISDETVRDYLDTLTLLPECSDSDYICILTEEAQGDVVIPDKNHSLVLVTALPGACDDITSLSMEWDVKYLEHLCSFESDNPTLTSVRFSATTDLLAVNDCFNHCSALREIDHFTTSSSRDNDPSIEASFCYSPALESFDLPYLSSISDSFLYCESLKTLTTSEKLGSVTGSFNHCSALESIEYKAKPKERDGYATDTITDSFNDCSSLKALAFSGKVAEYKNAFNRCSSLQEVTASWVSVDNSFNNCAALESLSSTSDTFVNSFNECTSLKTIELENKIETLTNSFRNCPTDINSVLSSEEQKEKRKQENDRMNELIAKIEKSWKNLYDGGAIPKAYPDLAFETAYSGDERLDELVFNDDSVRARLAQKPDIRSDNTISYYNDYFHYDEDEVTLFDCRYLITYEGFTSHTDKQKYQSESNKAQPPVTVYGNDKTTLVYVVDVEKEEIAFIYTVGTSVITFPEETTLTEINGEILTDEAEAYIETLLK